ncbi:MAG: hypothetical protein ABJN26_05975 [Stappiaceae bacterium]
MSDIVYLMNVDETPASGETLLNTRAMSDHILEWVNRKVVYLTSDDTIERLVNRVPGHLMRRTAGAFTCGGTEFWMHGERVWVHPHSFSSETLEAIQIIIDDHFPEYSNSLELTNRPGLINASLIARHASLKDRQSFGLYDEEHDVRKRIADLLSEQLPQYKIRIAGEVSLDIFPHSEPYEAVRQFVTERHRGASIGHLHPFT